MHGWRISSSLCRWQWPAAYRATWTRACRVYTRPWPPRQDPLYESNSTCVPVQSRYRGAISLGDHTAPTIFCLPCDVIDYRIGWKRPVPRFNCLDCRGGKRFSSFVLRCRLKITIEYNISNSLLFRWGAWIAIVWRFNKLQRIRLFSVYEFNDTINLPYKYFINNYIVESLCWEKLLIENERTSRTRF